jgi:hypothetical protein
MIDVPHARGNVDADECPQVLSPRATDGLLTDQPS